jgi:oligopeptide transport system substrate-binding protein
MLRKALALAINRQEIIDHVVQGNQIPASGLVPLSFGLQDAPYFQDGNVAEARRLFNEVLERMQLSVKTFPEIKFLYVGSERNHLTAQVIEQQWYKAFGIRVKLESCELKFFFDRLHKQDYQLAFSDWIADFNDPINFLDVFRYKKGSSNDTQWENADYAQLLERSGTEVDPHKRLQLLKQSEKIFMEEMPILPLYYSTMLYVQQPRLKDVVVSSMSVLDLKWANVE